MFGGNFIGVCDYKNIPLHEGDIIQWPNQETLGVIRYEKNSCQFRIQFEDKTTYSCHVGLQMGEKGMAIKIGSVYKNPELAPWASL
jgi:hypothetical protein